MNGEVTQIHAGEKIRSQRTRDGALWRVSLDAPKGNVLDAAMTAELTDLFCAAAEEPRLKAVLLTAEGPHFSFGASVDEHRAEKVGGMLAGFHGLFRAIAASGVPVVAAVRGRCLGGGLELVAFCQRIYAHPEASFGQPEIALGVFAPVASAILADRVGRGAADDLLLTGRVVNAEEAREMRLVDQVADSPEEAAVDWVEEHLMPRSASSLRFATRAARLAFARCFDRDIEELERLYLDGLMATRDANEGITAFLEKRKPTWSDA
jgi:cyclohexa-1,5-dienecarbonyl-CoA hydratase